MVVREGKGNEHPGKRWRHRIEWGAVRQRQEESEAELNCAMAGKKQNSSRSMTPKVFSFIVVLCSLFLVPLAEAQSSLSIRLENRSTENVKLLRGNNAGKGNEDGSLKPGESRVVNSVQGRVWSFMIAGKLAGSYRTTGQPNQQFVFTNEMVRAAFPGSPAGAI